MTLGESSFSETTFSDTPTLRRFIGAILGRVAQMSTFRGKVSMRATHSGTIQQRPQN